MSQTTRKATPDSEAVGSSEDERPWPTASSFGSFPQKENGVPGLGGGIWSTQKRGSFKMEKAAQRNAAREARLGAPNQPHGGLRGENTPSPAASEGSAALPFSIPLQPGPKAGRSMSHSQGQREVPHTSGTHSGSTNHTATLPLGLLTEEVDTESEDELGGGLTHTTSHPPMSFLQRTSTYPSTYDNYYGTTNGKESGETNGGAQAALRSDRRFDAAFANLSLDQPHRRAQWQSHLGWDDVPNVNESRRHSLADIPTRRGSLVGADNRGSMGGGPHWPDDGIYDWEGGPHTTAEQQLRETQFLEDLTRQHNKAIEQQASEHIDAFNTYNQEDEQDVEFQIPEMYRVPFVKLAEHERSQTDKRNQQLATVSISPWGGGGRPRKQLYIVSFKCSRVDVFYLLENTGLFIKAGDIVIVEADRGQDLGTVQHANVSPDDARLYKRKYGEEQYKWLMMFSKNNNQSSVNPNAQIYGENSSRSTMIANAPSTMQGLPRDNFNNLKPKAIKRLANTHEIRMLTEKEGNEAKAKRACQQKVAHLHLDMEILDAEWQWDFQKLIFYYYADHYINFKDLITELYRIYKTRIWLSAINPASFSQHALGQPPSGIGPGAVTVYHSNNTYTMMYGPDPDPYGAVPPYQIGYETYTPNYPGIPGVTNSFAPNAQQPSNDQPYASGSGPVAPPSVAPGATQTGSATAFGRWYQNGMTRNSAPTPPGGSATFGAYAPTTPTMATTPSMSSERNTLPADFEYQDFNQISRAARYNFPHSLGGYGPLPPPIGTRPQTNENNTPTTTSSGTPGSGGGGYTGGLQSWSMRAPPAFGARQQAGTQMQSSFLNGVRNAPQSSASSSNWARPGAGTGAQGSATAEAMRSYLENMSLKGDKKPSDR